LLIVGDPQRIPYQFQYQLDVAHAVGRIHFDTLDEYYSYACNGPDPATQLSAAQLVAPLATTFAQQFSQQAGWQVHKVRQLRTRSSRRSHSALRPLQSWG